MTRVVRAPLLFLAALLAVDAEPCVTPDGAKGDCVQIFGCPALANLLRNEKRSPEDVLLLQKSSCGFEGKTPKVCCPGICLTSEGEQGTCVTRSSCPHLPKTAEPKRCIGSDSICCPPPKPEVRVETCEKSLTAYPFPPLYYCCGKDSVTDIKISYIGSPTGIYISQYPWLALIEYGAENNKTKLKCGGSLISGKYVLTAAHCITGAVLKHGKPIGVRLGEYDTTKEIDCATDPYSGALDCASANDTITIPVESAISHPLFDSRTGKHDIGLIRLKELAPYTDFIQPICLPTKDNTLDKIRDYQLFVSGWGLGSSTYKNMVKQDVALPYVEKKDCQKYFRKDNITLEDGQICAGGEIGKNPCKGDSGGTLMYLNHRSSSFEALGVMSFGKVCVIEDIPTVYTKVFEYIDWIYSVIKP